MVNKYKRKTQQCSWTESTMKKAIQEVVEMKKAIKTTATKYGIPRATLQRHLKTGSCKKKLGRFTTVFSAEQELELLNYVFEMDSVFYGLSKEEFLRLVFQYAEKNHISHPFKDGTAGSDWYKGFISRHPDLTLRKPEPTSIARTRGFNKPQVYRFFDLLEEQIQKHGIDATLIYNMDETGVQTSSNKPPRVLTKVGKRQVGLIASSERDDLELNSDDKLSDDDALATFPSQPRQAPIASSSAGGGEDPRDDERCDSCRGGLSGIRLVCVQCSYSHCVACETSGRHRHHYMLRVPANGQKKVLERLVKIIQTELPEIDANYKSDADPSDEPLIIKTEIKTEEEEPDPLGEATIYTEQLRPEEVLEQTMLEIDKGCLGQVVDPPPAPAMQATTSAHPATNIIPTTGASVASKRRASSSTQPSAPKKVTSPQQYEVERTKKTVKHK
ncbi:uncharacterized protein LOC126377877 isoform X2 [Pectinophora gossypiella]|uniref:uncharacterized protein LOC126377877 isoform X2 n=1 Tax=Pectinophora gossypiella TaxID=13191 RepID=UPI00214E6D5F|nr:uncharacterized protein LOC126377877 isoform X2 [Pectinophora gossypiella]